AFHGNPQNLERVGGGFSLAWANFCSHERPETEGCSSKRRDTARACDGEGERAGNRSATTGQSRRHRSSRKSRSSTRPGRERKSQSKRQPGGGPTEICSVPQPRGGKGNALESVRSRQFGTSRWCAKR